MWHLLVGRVFEITRQHGCVARKSIAASGPQMYFLSDDGVFTLQQGLDLGIRCRNFKGKRRSSTAIPSNTGSVQRVITHMRTKRWV